MYIAFLKVLFTLSVLTVIGGIKYLLLQELVSIKERMRVDSTKFYRFISGGTWYKVKIDTVPFISISHHVIVWRREPPSDVVIDGVLVVKETLLDIKK